MRIISDWALITWTPHHWLHGSSSSRQALPPRVPCGLVHMLLDQLPVAGVSICLEFPHEFNDFYSDSWQFSVPENSAGYGPKAIDSLPMPPSFTRLSSRSSSWTADKIRAACFSTVRLWLVAEFHSEVDWTALPWVVIQDWRCFWKKQDELLALYITPILLKVEWPVYCPEPALTSRHSLTVESKSRDKVLRAGKNCTIGLLCRVICDHYCRDIYNAQHSDRLPVISHIILFT